MGSELTVNFVDGSDVEMQVSLQDKQVRLFAFDEKSRKRYRLTFSDCTLVSMQYSTTDEPDLGNLTDGIEEIIEADTSRVFTIGFADESILEIRCNSFEMIEVSHPND